MTIEEELFARFGSGVAECTLAEARIDFTWSIRSVTVTAVLAPAASERRRKRRREGNPYFPSTRSRFSTPSTPKVVRAIISALMRSTWLTTTPLRVTRLFSTTMWRGGFTWKA